MDNICAFFVYNFLWAHDECGTFWKKRIISESGSVCLPDRQNRIYTKSENESESKSRHSFERYNSFHSMSITTSNRSGQRNLYEMKDLKRSFIWKTFSCTQRRSVKKRIVQTTEVFEKRKTSKSFLSKTFSVQKDEASRHTQDSIIYNWMDDE